MPLKVILELQCFKVIMNTQIHHSNRLFLYRKQQAWPVAACGCSQICSQAPQSCCCSGINMCFGCTVQFLSRLYTNSHAVRNGRLQWACKIPKAPRVQNPKHGRPRLCCVLLPSYPLQTYLSGSLGNPQATWGNTGQRNAGLTYNSLESYSGGRKVRLAEIFEAAASPVL